METIIYGIAYKCSYGKRKNDCPLCEIDHLSFEEKIDWIDDLNENKKYLIEAFHVHCLERRERKELL